MSEYSIRSQIQGRYWTIAKFEGGKAPTMMYFVNEWEDGKLACTCPAQYHDNCKHRKMVRIFKSIGQPIMNCFWEDKGEIYGYHANITAEWREELLRFKDQGRGLDTLLDGNTNPNGVPVSHGRRKRIHHQRPKAR